MGTTPSTITMALVASVALLGVPGCSKKSVQSGGDTQSSQQAKTAKGESTESSRTGVGNFPDTSMQSGGGSGLRGLDKNPSEERVANALGSGSSNGVGAGSLLAKADTSDTAARQMEEIRAEQAASAAAGLRDVFFGYDSWTISDDQRQALNRDADPRALLYAVLHDAPDYVMGDIISPFKAAMGGNYKDVENRLLGAVHLHFALNAAAPVAVQRQIKKADKEAAYHEAVNLAGFAVEEARKFFGEPTLPAFELERFEQLIRPWPTREAHDRFVDAVDMLATAMHR